MMVGDLLIDGYGSIVAKYSIASYGGYRCCSWLLIFDIVCNGWLLMVNGGG